MSSNLNAALEYLDQGFSVIPIRPNGKRPLIKWDEFQSRHPAQDEVENWFERWPDANLAIVTGPISGVWVADADTYREKAAAAYLDEQLPATSIYASTPHGGTHAYFKLPSGDRVTNSAGRVAPGVDVRGEGGYVLAPPSTIDGKPYEFTFPAGFNGWDDLTECVPKGVGSEAVEPTGEGNLHLDLSQVQDPAWLLKNIPEGSRNNELTRKVGRWIALGLECDEVLLAAKAFNSQHLKPPMETSEVETVVDSVFKTHLRNHPNKANPNEPESNRFARHMTRAGDLLNGPWEPLEWVLDSSLLTRTTGMVVGAPGTGKSWFLLQTTAAVATGSKTFLDGIFTPGVQGTVVMICAEDDKRILQRRLAAIRDEFVALAGPSLDFNPSALQHDLENNLLLLPVCGEDIRMMKMEKGNLMESEAFTDLLAYLRGLENLALVVLDPLSRLHGADENDNNAGTLLISLVERICGDTGSSVILAHHVAKGSGMGQKGFDKQKALSPDAGRGASAFLGAVRWQLNLASLPKDAAKKELGLPAGAPGYLVGKVSKKNYGLYEEEFYLHRGEGGVLRKAETPKQAQARQEAEELDFLVGIVLEEMSTLEENKQKITPRQFKSTRANIWKEKYPDIQISQSRIQTAIDQAIIEGKLTTKTEPNASGRKTDYLCLPAEVLEVSGQNEPALQGQDTSKPHKNSVGCEVLAGQSAEEPSKGEKFNDSREVEKCSDPAPTGKGEQANCSPSPQPSGAEALLW